MGRFHRGTDVGETEKTVQDHSARLGQAPVIRAYDPSDLAALVGIFTASVHKLAAAHYSPAQRRAWAPSNPQLDPWRQRLAGLRTLVAEIDAAPAGFVGYEDDGHIDLLFVSPQAPRRGLATALYHEAEARLRARGVDRVFTEASLVARPFFERQGFHIEAEQNVSRGGASFRRYAMIKALPKSAPGAAPE